MSKSRKKDSKSKSRKKDSEFESPEFYFVFPKSHEKTRAKVSQITQEAFEHLKNEKFFPVCISETKLTKSLIEDESSIFIVESLDHEFVKPLASAGRIVTTPLSILYFKNYNTKYLKKHLPYTSPCLKKCRIALDGVFGEKAENIIQQIYDLGGIYCEDMISQKCDILISDVFLTEKYDRAFEMNIPIVSPKWIFECYDNYQHKLLFGFDKQQLEPHFLKPFHNLKIAVSDVSNKVFFYN